MKTVTLLGATSFVAKQFLKKYSNLGERLGVSLKATLRSEEKQQEFSKLYPKIEFVLLDLTDSDSRKKIIGESDIVLNFAGPYSLFGFDIVADCIEGQCHYLDLTGEPPFIKKLIDSFDSKAKENKVLILPGAGFDSIPSDMGAYLLAQESLSRFGEKLKRCDSIFYVKGGFNGGTIASAFLIAEELGLSKMGDPYYYLEEECPSYLKDLPKSEYLSDIKKTVASFFMEPINSKTVYRSRSLLGNESPFAEEFLYREWAPLGGARLKGLKKGIANTFFGGTDLIMDQAVGRSFLKKILPKPGSGPSQKSMNTGFFKAKLYGQCKGHSLIGTMSSEGDPGNISTIKLMVSGLRAVLELAPREFGVGTFSSSFRDQMLPLLIEEGIDWKVD